MKNEIYTVYSQDGDMTFIMEDTENTVEVKRFYFGESDTFIKELSSVVVKNELF